MFSDGVKIALIGLVGTTAGAALGNWDRIFSEPGVALKEQNFVEGKEYKFTAIALPEVSGKCQDKDNRLLYAHWCFIVSKTKPVE